MTIPDETFSALEAEVAALIDVLLEAFSDPEAMEDGAIVADGLARFGERVERIGALAEAGGLDGLGRVCGLFLDQLRAIARLENPLEDRQRELLEEWPGLTVGYLGDPADAAAGEALVSHLQNPAWPKPLSEVDAARLSARLAAPWTADSEEGTTVILPEHAQTTEPVIAWKETSERAAVAPTAQPEVEEAVGMAPPSLPEEEEGLSPALEYADRRVPAASLGESALSPEPAAPVLSREPDMAFEAPAATHLPAETVGAKPPESGLNEAVPAPAQTAETELIADGYDLPEPEDRETVAAEKMAAVPLEPKIETRSPEAFLAEMAPQTSRFEAAPLAVEPELPEPDVARVEIEEAELPGSDAASAEAEPEPSESETAPLEMEAELPESDAALEGMEPEFPSEAEETSAPAEIDQELVELLRAEVGSLEEAGADLKAVAIDPSGDAEARREALLSHAEEIARFAGAAEAMGFVGLQQATDRFHGNVLALASQSRPLTGIEYDLVAGWPARAMNYLRGVADRDTCRALVDHLRQAGWPKPLPADGAGALADLLVAPTLALPEQMVQEARPLEALADDVSLVLPEDVNPELLDSLLQELPAQTAELSAAIQRLAGGEGDLRDVAVAQRIAHTVKGAGNTVGVRGIANLTHHMEDILVALSKRKTLPNRPLAEALSAASDCLEGMSEALVGLSPPPPQARTVLQAILDWANRIDREGLTGGEEIAPPPQPAKILMETAALPDFPEAVEPEEAAAPSAAKAEPAGLVPMLRVPASLVDELLRLVGESIILTGQIQERARKALRQARGVQAQHQVFQRLTADLEQLVEIRGIAPVQGRSAGKGDFDLLELEQYNELNTVTHRLLEAAADSRALDQDIREDLTALDNLLVTQGRLHRESQEAVLRTRMVPVKTIVPRLQRSVRQTCRLTDKEVKFTVGGDETLMDSNLLADITDPLMHVLRNAVDHGVESPERRQALGKNPVGRIDLSFIREGDTIVVRCRDDGAGLDFAAIRQIARQKGLIAADAAPGEAELCQLILTSGFTTRSETTQTSGRGIGLDAVNSRLQELRGSFQIRSEAGRGCQVELRLPVTLIAIHALLARLHGQQFAISSRGVQQILYAGLGEIRRLGAKTLYQLGDEYYEFTSLETLLDLPPDRRASERHIPSLLLVREGGGATRAVLVQEVLDSRDLVVKPLGRYFPKLGGIIGATILGDGSVVPVLDLPELLRAPSSGAAPRPRAGAAPPSASAPRPKRRSALVVDDSLSARRALALAVEEAGLEVRTARDGLEAVAMIEAHRPDLLLVDLEMPRMNGLELTSHVRARETTRTLPVIMVTSRSTAKHRREARAVGVDFYLTKPFADEELFQTITAALRGGATVEG